MPSKRTIVFDPKKFLVLVGSGKSIQKYRDKEAVFKQGDVANAVFYIENGKVQLTVLSHGGKEAVIALLDQGSFFGEGCLAGQPLRISTAIAVNKPTIVRVEKKTMVRLLHERPAFAESFLTYLLSRNIRIEEDLVDQLFNSSEKRLARILLLLARYGNESKPETLVSKVSQETLSAMIGSTRARVSYFMNKFRRLGFIEYNGGVGGLKVHNSLLNIVLHD